MKKGFTLVELLAVLAIIAILSILAFNGILSKSNELKDLSNEKYAELIKVSAKMYINSDSKKQQLLKSGETIIVSYKDLQDAGYLTKELKDLNNKNVNTTSKCIRITYSNYSYNYEIANCN